MIMHIAGEELRKALITRITLEKIRRGIKSLSILKLILITSVLMMKINIGIDKLVVLVVYITMWLLSVGRE